ncbi:MAG: helix-turn-helix domain-containing protein [Candidatus Limnocylindrales bacterium]
MTGPRPTDWSQVPLVLSVEEAATLLGIGRNAAYSLVANRTLPSIRLGRRIVVARQAIEDLLANAPHGLSDVDGWVADGRPTR